MLERDGFPPGVPCWVDTTQSDPDAAAAFSGDLFGWEFEDRDAGVVRIASLQDPQEAVFPVDRFDPG